MTRMWHKTLLRPVCNGNGIKACVFVGMHKAKRHQHLACNKKNCEKKKKKIWFPLERIILFIHIVPLPRRCYFCLHTKTFHLKCTLNESAKNETRTREEKKIEFQREIHTGKYCECSIVSASGASGTATLYIGNAQKVLRMFFLLLMKK